MNDLQKILNIQEFATLPQVTTKVLQYLERDDFTFSELAKLIETDPALSIKLIKVANSPMFATRAEITSIQQAVQILGMNRVANLVLAVSIFSKFMISENSMLADIVNKFWWHSSCTGIVAKSIAKKLDLNFNEKEFLIGLLHDIGKLAMLQYDSNRYLKVMELIDFDDSDPLIASEKFFDCNHIDVTIAILEKWKMPQEFVIISTRDLSKCESDTQRNLLSVVFLANVFCEIWGSGFYGGIKKVQIQKEEYWKALKKLNPRLETFDLELFTIELEEEFKNTKNFLELLQS